MVRIVDYKARMSAEEEPFFALIVQGGISFVKSKETGLFYATPKKQAYPPPLMKKLVNPLLVRNWKEQLKGWNVNPTIS